jgi:sulfite exporter TauE/SafE
VVSYTAKNALNGYKGLKQHFVYGGSKVLSYAIVGGIFGLIGGVFTFSIKLRGVIAILAGLFMVFYALSMFGFKFFRRFQFNPKFLMKASAEVSSKVKGPFRAPFIIGLLNGLFLACGPLQAMYLYAMGTGSFFTGAISLAVFGFGTLPVMLGFGFLATTISHKTTAKILKISAILVLILGLIMLNRGLSLTGSGYDINSIQSKISGGSLSSAFGSEIKDGVQEINMEVTARGWTPNSFVLRQGIPVRWNIDVKELTGCNNEIIVNAYNLDIKLKQGLNVVEFTPDKLGTISWSCWMGMIPGTFIVTEDGKATTAQVASATPKSSGTCGMASGGSCGGSCGGGCGGCGGAR